MSPCSLTAHSCVYWIKEFTKLDKRFCVYFAAVTLLHVTRKISRNGFSDKFMDIVLVSTVLDPNFNQFSVILSRCKTELNTSEVQNCWNCYRSMQLNIWQHIVSSWRETGSVATTVTRLWGTARVQLGDWQRCLELSISVSRRISA